MQRALKAAVAIKSVQNDLVRLDILLAPPSFTMPSNPFKDLSPRKNTRIGDGYLKDATDETKQNSDHWDDQALADLRGFYTEYILVLCFRGP